MSASDSGNSTRDERINQIVAEYLRSIERGEVPDRSGLLARHADIAEELSAFFADHDRFQRAAAPLAGALTLPPSDSPAPSRGPKVAYFGDYELLEEIARGGMGVVYKARQMSLNRPVALKMILAGEWATPGARQRFRAEAEAAANLQHPNIVAIHEVGEHQGQQYFSMDFVVGKNLAELVRGNPLSAERAASYVKTIAEAVHFAHQRGTLHRDLKPQNVLIDADDRPRITDFGLAKRVETDSGLTRTGDVLGTPSYMPPEQASSRPDEVGPHSDVYSLGAILYELLTGHPPFRGATALDTLCQVIQSPPASLRKLNPDVPQDLETICLKCLEKNPARRYPSARALADELGRFLKHEPIQALPVSAVRKAESWLRHHPWTLMAAASLIAMVLMGLLYWQYERVKFLENRPLITDRALRPPDVRTFELWRSVMFFLGVPGTLFWTLLIFRQYGRGKPNVQQLFRVTSDWAPSRPVSQGMRVVCGLIGVAALAVTVLYLAKFIHESVWENSPSFLEWCGVYANFYLSLVLLFRVVRDYQKVIHGMPSQTLSTEQSESLRQAIRDGDTVGAIKLVRRAFPDASLAVANAYLGKFAREELYRQRFPGASLKESREGSEKHYAEYIAELKAKHPGKFLPSKPWDLNWWLMSKTLVVEAGLFAGLWLIAPPPVSPGTRLLVYAASFLCGVGIMTSSRVKSSWKRVLGMMLCFLLPIVCFLLPIVMTPRFYQDGIFFLLGFLSGTSMIMSGFTPKRRKSTPDNRPLNDVSPPH
jgi:tRNA A-37 threonylcarbamoyl transferase component Bud32